MAETPKPDYDVTGEVLFDQLEFLLWARVKHLEHNNDCGCEDCLRYTRVRDILMEPFGEKTERAVRPHQKKAQKAVG